MGMSIFSPRQARSKDGRFSFGRRVAAQPVRVAPLAGFSDDWGSPDCGEVDNPFAELMSQRWAGTDGMLSSRVAAAPSGGVVMDVDRGDVFRFGPGNQVHARVDQVRHCIDEKLTCGEEFTRRLPDGGSERVRFNFNPSKIRDDVHALSARVLEAAGELPAGRDSGLSWRRGVYSPRTVDAARRVYNSWGADTFTEPRFPGESTTVYPCRVDRDGLGTQYTYGLHPDVDVLISGAERDLGASEGLRSDELAHRARSERVAGGSFADW